MNIDFTLYRSSPLGEELYITILKDTLIKKQNLNETNVWKQMNDDPIS